MAYDLILAVACIILAIRFAFETDVALWTRVVVAAAAVGSFYSPWYTARILIQVIESLYVLLYLRAKTADTAT